MPTRATTLDITLAPEGYFFLPYELSGSACESCSYAPACSPACSDYESRCIGDYRTSESATELLVNGSFYPLSELPTWRPQLVEFARSHNVRLIEPVDANGVNTYDAPPGSIAVHYYIGSNACDKCSIQHNCHTHNCTASERADGKSVYFLNITEVAAKQLDRDHARAISAAHKLTALLDAGRHSETKPLYELLEAAYCRDACAYAVPEFSVLRKRSHHFSQIPPTDQRWHDKLVNELPVPPYALVHRSTQDPTKAAWHPTFQHFWQDRQVRTSIGKIVKTLGGDDELAKQISEMFRPHVAADIEYIGNDPDAWVEAYSHPVRALGNSAGCSCMHGEDCVQVYAHPDSPIKLAVVRNTSGAVIARSIVRRGINAYLRVYGSDELPAEDFKNLLESVGIERNECMMEDVPLQKIEHNYDSNKYLMPYIDGHNYSVDNEGDSFVITSNGDYDCRNTSGYITLEPEYETYCDRCNGGCAEDDRYTVWVSRSIAELWCEDCVDAHPVSRAIINSYGETGYVPIDDVVSTNDEGYVADWLDINHCDCCDEAFLEDSCSTEYVDRDGYTGNYACKNCAADMVTLDVPVNGVNLTPKEFAVTTVLDKLIHRSEAIEMYHPLYGKSSTAPIHYRHEDDEVDYFGEPLEETTGFTLTPEEQAAQPSLLAA